MLDYVIRSGTVIDGTGEPGRLADVGIRDGRIVAIGQIDEDGRHRVRRRRAHRDARRGRPAHALRRAALLGPLGLPLQRARRDHGHRGQLRVHAGPHQRRGRRLHPPDDGQGRGDAAGRPGERRAVELVDLRGVPRHASRAGWASTPASWWGTAPCGARSWAPTAARRWRPTTRSPPCAPCWPSPWRPGGWASRPPSPAPTPTATVAPSARATPIAARCSPSARRWRPTRAPRSSTSPTGAWTPSRPKRSTS